jgi:outer membrane protein TolC
VVAARARAAERSGSPGPKLNVATVALTELRLELLQPVRRPWESSALRAVGKQDVAAVAADAAADRRGVMLDAARRLADGLRSGQALALAVAAESLTQKVADLVAPSGHPEQANDLEGLETLTALDEAHRARVQAQLRHTIAQGRLASLLGRDPGTPVVFAGELAAIAPLTDAGAVLATALATDPQSARLEHDAARAEQEARLARARRWPALELGPAVTVGDNARLGVALGIAVPWNRQRAAIRAAHAERDTALFQLEVRHRELPALVTEALVTLTLADSGLGLLRGRTLARAARALSLAEQAAPQRGAAVLAWLVARAAYLDARATELDLEWQAANARLLLRSVTGSLVMEEP